MPNRSLLPLLAALALCTTPVRGQSTLPDGLGKDTVQTVCTQCHSLDQVVNAGDTRAGWQNTVAMMRNAGAPLRDDQVATVVDYLATNFSGAARAARRADPRQRERDHPRMARADARFATARSVGRGRRHDLVHRTHGERLAIWIRRPVRSSNTIRPFPIRDRTG